MIDTIVISSVAAVIAAGFTYLSTSRKLNTEEFKSLIEANQQLRSDMTYDRNEARSEIQKCREEILSLRAELVEARDKIRELREDNQ